MPSNYTGNAGISPVPVVIAEPIDGDADNGATFQTPLSTLADNAAYAIERLESMLCGPATPRGTTTAFNAGNGAIITPIYVSSLGTTGRFVLLGQNGVTTPLCQTSDDGGASYTSRASFATAFGTKVPSVAKWNGALLVAVGNTGTLATSTDGITWTSRTSGTAQDIISIDWSPARALWIIGASAGYVATSPDGITWTSRATGLPAAGISVSWGVGPALFVTFSLAQVGTANCIATSPDGVTWTLRTAPTTGGAWVRYAPYSPTPLFLLNNAVAIYSSPDGINWTSRLTISGGGSYAEGNTFFTGRSFAMTTTTAASPMYTSKDGITWIARVPPAPVGGGAGGGGVPALGGVWYTYNVVGGNGGLANTVAMQYP